MHLLEMAETPVLTLDRRPAIRADDLSTRAAPRICLRLRFPRTHVIRGGAIALGCLQLAGCAIVADVAYSTAFRLRIEDASTLSQDELERVRAIPLLTSGNAQRYSVLGLVEGLACKLPMAWKPTLSIANGSTPEEAAMMQLKLAARRVGGTALLSPSCTHSDGVDWGNDCYESWVCVGQAVKVSN